MRTDLNAPVASVEDALTRRYPEACDQPCRECPWRKDSAPGWLGPQSADEWLRAVHGETPIACHMTIPRSGGWGRKTKQCRGAASFRANVFKTPMNSTVAVGPRDDSVFGSDAEFRAHHE